MPYKRKIKKNMKGGAEPVPSAVNNDSLSKNQIGSSVSTYGKYNHNLFLWAILMIGTAGFIWFLISRSLITHRNSEAISYGIMALGVVLSVFLLISISIVYGDKNQSGFKKMLRTLFTIFIDGIPAWLILAQIVFLITLLVRHSDYMFLNNEKPQIFNMCNISSAVLIFIQLYMWSNKVKAILKNAGTGNKMAPDYISIGVMVLIGILSGICISQMYVILEMLRTDC